MSGEYNPSPEGNPSFLARRKSVPNRTGEVHWQAHPEVSRSGARLVTVDGFQAVAHHENHAALTLSGLCLVPTIREAATRFAQVRLIGSGSCRRFFLGTLSPTAKARMKEALREGHPE